MKKKGFFGILLSLVALILGLMPAMNASADSYEGNPYASLVNTTTTVSFNGYSWYIIADNSTAVNQGTVTLFAYQPIGLSPFHTGGKNTYNNSTVKGFLDAQTEEGGAFFNIARAIVPTDLTDVNVTSAKLYLLSDTELGLLNTNVRKCKYVNGMDNTYCWLRTPKDTSTVYRVDSTGGYTWANHVTGNLGVRPALKLNLSKVKYNTTNKTFTYDSSTDIAVEKVTLDKDSAQSITLGDKIPFTASVIPDSASDKTVKWTVGGTNASAVKLYTDEDCTTEVGTAIPIAIEDNTSRPHVLRWAITNGPSGSANISAGAETYSLAMPLSNLNSMTTAASFAITYELETQTTGGSKIGMVRKTGTITVPEDVKPTVTGATVAPVSSSSAHPVPSAWGLYIAGHSMAHVALSSGVQTAYGASITTYKITGNGASASASSLPISADSNELQAGTYTFTVTATDTRGRSGSQQLTVTVEPYAVPTLQNILSLRTDSTGAEDDEGTYILAQAGATFASCGGNNNVTVAVSYKKETDSTYTAAGSLADGQLLFGAGNITLRDNYNVRYIVTDALGESRTYNDIVTRSVWEMHVRRGGGAWAFGGVADTPGALHVYGGLKLDTPLAVADGGTGANTKANAKAALDIDDLETNMAGVKFLRTTVPGNGNRKFTFSGDCRYIILTTGYQVQYSSMICGTCTSGGSVYAHKLNVGSTSALTTSTGSFTLTISNGSSSQTNAVMIVLSGTTPTLT